MSTENPLVSVIIPNYNHAQYVGDAIRSVLVQSYRNFEVIVVDDGSTDHSRQIIDGFSDQVRTIYQQNGGLSAARNTGIRTSRGSMIGVLDADDLYEPDYLQTLVQALQEHADAAGIYCGYQFVDGMNRPLPQIEAREVSPERLYQALIDGNFLVPESMFLRKYCYDKVGLFDTSLSALEDFDMWLRVTREFRIIHTTELLTRHRVLPGSMSTNATRQFENRMSVVKKHFGTAPNSSGKWTDQQRQAYGRAYLLSAVEYLQANDEGKAAGCMYAMTDACPRLLTQVESFYELACGKQPKGYRGDFASVDLDQNFLVLMQLLERLSESPKLENFKKVQEIAHAQANYAFALIAYGQGNTKAARKFMFRAMRHYPRLVLAREVAGSLLRVLLGAEVVHRLKRSYVTNLVRH